MTLLLKYWPLWMTFGTLLMGGWQLSAAIERHLNIEAANCQRTEVLERILAQEFPAYTPAIWYRGVASCGHK